MKHEIVSAMIIAIFINILILLCVVVEEHKSMLEQSTTINHESKE